MSGDLITAFKSSNIEPFYLGGCSATISADGDVLVTPLLEDIVISNPKTNEIITKLEGDGEMISSLQITPDGRYVAIVSQSQQLKVYNIAEQRFIKTFKFSSPVYVSCVDETSTLFAFGGSDGVITVWDIENGYVTHSLKGHGTTISSLSFYGELNSTKWWLTSGDIMGNLKIWDLVKRKNVQSFQEHNSAIRGCAINRTGEIMISGGRDKILNIYKFATPKSKLKDSLLVDQQVETCGFIEIEEKEYVYTAGSDNLLKIWDVDSLSLVATSEPHLETTEELMVINVLKISPQAAIILVLSDQSLVSVDVSNFDKVLPTITYYAGNHGTIADLTKVGPKFDKIALATNSPSLRVISASRPMEFELYEAHKDLLNNLDVSVDGRWLATCSKDGEAIVWRYNDESDKFEVYVKFLGHSSSVTCCSLPKTFLQEGQIPAFLITASSDLTIKKWKIPKTGATTLVVKTSEYTRKAHEKDINCIDVSPNDQYIATGSFDKTGKIWDLDSGEVVGILKGHKRGLWDIRFSSFDKLVLTGSGDKFCKLWSLQDFTCLKTFEGHTNSVQKVSFMNKQKQVITTGADGLIKIWDNSNAECISTLDNHDNRIWSLYCNELNEFISADADGKIAIWEDNTDELRAAEEEQEKLKVENEQSLQNYIHGNDWANAFLLALSLNHPMRLYNVIKSSIASSEDPESTVGSFKLEECISKLTQEQLLILLERIKTWNVNGKTFEIGQKLIKVILTNFEIQDLIKIPRINNIAEILTAYNERHMSRLNDLIEQSYILDYTIDELNNAIVS